MSLNSISNNSAAKSDLPIPQKENSGDLNGKVVTVTTQLNTDLIREIVENICFSGEKPVMHKVIYEGKSAISCLSLTSKTYCRTFGMTTQLIKFIQRLIEWKDLRELEHLRKDLKKFIQDPKNFKNFLHILVRDVFDGKFIQRDLNLDEMETLIGCLKIKPEEEKVFFDFLAGLLKRVSSLEINPSQADFLMLLLRNAFRRGSEEKLKELVTLFDIEAFYLLFPKLEASYYFSGKVYASRTHEKKSTGVADKIFDLSFKKMTEKYPSLLRYDTDSYKCQDGLMDLLEPNKRDPERLNKICSILCFLNHCMAHKFSPTAIELVSRYRDSKISVETLVSFIKKNYLFSSINEKSLFLYNCSIMIAADEKQSALKQEMERQGLRWST